jgi:hypothetical protein
MEEGWDEFLISFPIVQGGKFFLNFGKKEEGKKKVIEVSKIFDATCRHATKIVFFSS